MMERSRTQKTSYVVGRMAISAGVMVISPCQRVSYDISILISHFKLKAESHLESEWFFVISQCMSSSCFLVTYFFEQQFFIS